MRTLKPLMAAIEDHDGTFDRRMAHMAGVSDARLRTLVNTGTCLRVQPGVFVVAGSRPRLGREMRWCLLAHDASALSHDTAAAIHRFRYMARQRHIHMLGPFRSSARSRVAVLHRSRRLADRDVMTVDRLRVTTPERTIIDLAGSLSPARLERVLDGALADRKVDLGRLRREFARLGGRGRRGTRVLRRLLVARSLGTAVVESELERRFDRLVRDYDLPTPTRQVPIWRERQFVGRVDFAWPQQRVLVEVDGRRGHQQVVDFENDRRRDAQAVAEGWFPVRLTWSQVVREPSLVADAVRQALQRVSGEP